MVCKVIQCEEANYCYAWGKKFLLCYFHELELESWIKAEGREGFRPGGEDGHSGLCPYGRREGGTWEDSGRRRET